MTTHYGPHEHARLPVGAMWVTTCARCGKRGYKTRKDAKRAARTFHPGDTQRPYRCPVLPDLWHFGHRPEWVTQGAPNPAHVAYLIRRMRQRGVIPANTKEILMSLDPDTIRVLRAVADAGQYDPGRPNEQAVSKEELDRVAEQGLIEVRRTADGTDTGFYQLRAAGLHELENAGEKPVDKPPAEG